jgi:hypothetical protein
MTYQPAGFFDTAILEEKSVKTTISAAQSASFTRAVLNGSEIEYEPHEDATHVLYRCSFQWINVPDNNTHIYLALMDKTLAGDPWAYVTDRQWSTSALKNIQYCSYETIEILLPTWSGSKFLSIYVRTSTSATECTLNQLKLDGTSYDTGSEGYVDVSVSCTSMRSS